MIVAGDERGQEEEEEVAGGCYGDVEPKTLLHFAVRGLVEVDDGASQSRLLEGIGDDAEDGDHGDHAIVARREKAAQDDSEDESYELHSAIVYRARRRPRAVFSFKLLAIGLADTCLWLSGVRCGSPRQQPAKVRLFIVLHKKGANELIYHKSEKDKMTGSSS